MIITPTRDAIEAAARRIRDGGLVAMPTETVYGLAADATNADAVLSIYETKGRPRFNPLIVHVATTEQAWQFGRRNTLAETLAARFWPGPLTLVLSAVPASGIADIVTAGLATIAIRCPSHPVAEALIRASGRPLAAPSANRSGRISPTVAAHVEAEFSGAVHVLDGGACDQGIESTIIALDTGEPVLLRAGSLPVTEIESALGCAVARLNPAVMALPSAPGQLASHYAPRARIRLSAEQVMPGEALLAFGPTPLATSGPVINLSATADLREAAKALFAALRLLDETGAATIAVMPIPGHGLGEAINDRLSRAAAPRATGNAPADA